MPTYKMDVALIPLTRATTRAKRAGYLQPPRRSAKTTKAIIHGRPHHGRRITEILPEYWST